MAAALATGNLTAWAYFDDGPGPIDGEYLAYLTPDDFRAGGDFEPILERETGEPIPLQNHPAHWGRAIWIKRDEWAGFKRETLKFLDASHAPSIGRARAEKDCADWLSRKFVEQQIQPPKEQLRRSAIAEIQGLSARAFDRAWSAVAPAFDAHLPGRRRKS